ncbi:MAG: TonB C-terminal domain-containing protein [Bradymonadales bacterium]|jgi:hypothetical protein
MAKRSSTAAQLASFGITLAIHGLIVGLVVLTSSSAPQELILETPQQSLHCRYIEAGRIFQVQVNASNWQEAEERVCGGAFRDVRLSPLLLEGLTMILVDASQNPVVAAQRESCSCSEEENLPILQDVGIVEAPRLGAEVRRTALPRIINVPEQTRENVISTTKTEAKASDKKVKTNAPKIDDLLAIASDFDPARPISDVDPGGSADGSRHSKSATGKGDPYLQKVKAKLDNTMNAPASIQKSELNSLKARIRIKIGDNGSVWGWEFERKSGNAAFDRMIETTIKRFMLGGDMRFAAPPELWRLKNIPIIIDGSDVR